MEKQKAGARDSKEKEEGKTGIKLKTRETQGKVYQ